MKQTKKQITEEIKRLKYEINKIYSDADEKRDDFIRNNREVIEHKNNEIIKLKESLEKTKRKELEIPEKIENWFREYISGVDFGYGGIKIIYVSPKQRYVIVTNTGAMASTGSFWNPSYHQSSHWFVEVGSQQYRNSLNRVEKIEGRLTKEKKQEMIKKILELEKDE